MKILPILLIGGLVFVSTTEIVAGADDANSQILLQKIKADKKLVVAGNMGLTDEEARKFWPLYEEYQKELERLNLKLGETIREYAAAYNKGPLSDDTAKKLMDEALSVGDGVFVHRCMARIKGFQDAGGTILFVSHDIGSINRLCNKCVWIDGGQIREQGEPIEVSKSYQAFLYKQINEGLRSNSEKVEDSEGANLENVQKRDENLEPKQEKHINVNPFTQRNYLSFPNTRRFGTGRAEILSLEILNAEGEKNAFVMPDETLIIQGKIFTHDQVDSPVFGITMFDRLRVAIAGWNTTQYGHKLPSLEQGNLICIRFIIRWPHLKNDTYSLEPAIADGSQESHEMMDWIQTPISLESGVIGLTFGFMRFNDVKVSHNITSCVPDQLAISVSNQ